MTLPRGPLRLVLGFSTGSASEEIARALVPAWSEELGQAIQIDLQPGNNGVDAAARVAAARPDGSTLFMATLGTHALAPHLDPHLLYEPVRDFAPVSLLATAPLMLACWPGLPVTRVSELIEHAQRYPRELTYGTSAIGGAPHLAAELFQHLAGIEMRHVQYAQTRRLYEDLEAGRIALSFNNMMSMLPRCRSGTLRALAVTSALRLPFAEHIPTVAESGLAGYEVANWLGVVAPAGTPAATLAALRRSIVGALHRSAVASSFADAGVNSVGSTPEEFERFTASEIARWRPVVARFTHTSRSRDGMPHEHGR